MSNALLKKVNDSIHSATDELRKLVDEADGRDFEATEQEQYDKIKADLSAQRSRRDDLIELVADEAAVREARAKSGLDEIEDRNDSDKMTAAQKEMVAFDKFLRGEGGKSFTLTESRHHRPTPRTDEEARALLTNVTGAAEELVNPTYADMVWEHMVEESPILTAGVTAVRTAGGNEYNQPKTTSYSSATLVAEGDPIGNSEPGYGSVSIGAYGLKFLVDVSTEMTEDASYPLVDMVLRQGGAALGRGADTYFVAGTGVNQPQGILQAASSTGTTLASNTAITMDEIRGGIFHSIISPARANAKYVFNDDTMAQLAVLKDTNGQYYWQPSTVAGEPDRLNGKPVFSDHNIAELDGTANARVGWFGDPRGFFVRQAGGVRIERSEHAKWGEDLVSFRFVTRVDSRIIDDTAFRTIVASA